MRKIKNSGKRYEQTNIQITDVQEEKKQNNRRDGSDVIISYRRKYPLDD